MDENHATSPDKLNGKITFSVRDGFIRELGFVSKIVQLLNPTALGDTPGTAGYIFSSLNGTLTIKNGLGTLEKTILKSAAWNITAGGILDFVKEEMDVDVHVQPLQTVDKAVSWVPVIDRILKGKFILKLRGRWTIPKLSQNSSPTWPIKFLEL